MTLEQTRLLAVEFERRLYTINPSFAIENKIDTEEMYAYLNEYAQVLLSKAAEADAHGAPDEYGLILALSLMPAGNNFPAQMENALMFGQECVPFRIKNCFRFLGGSITEYLFDWIRNEMPDDYDLHGHEGRHTADSHGPTVLAHFKNSAPIVVYNTKDIQRVLRSNDNGDAILRHNPAVLWQRAGYTNRTMHDGEMSETEISDALYIYVFNGALNVVDLRGNNGTNTPQSSIPGIQLQARYIPNIPYFEVTYDNKEMCQLPMSCFNDLVEGAVLLYVERAMSATPKQLPKEQQKEQNKQ